MPLEVLLVAGRCFLHRSVLSGYHSAAGDTTEGGKSVDEKKDRLDGNKKIKLENIK